MSNIPPKAAPHIAAEEERKSAKTVEKGKKKQKKTVKQEILSWVWTLLAAIVIAGCIRALLFEPIRVDGSSMLNTLKNGQIVIVTKPAYLLGNYKRGDIVICRYPDRNNQHSLSIGGSLELSFTTHTLFVKRLIALPGDTIQITDGVVSVNGEIQDESKIDYGTVYTGDYGPLTLGKDEFFVMGDNRGNSHDSRSGDVGTLSGDMIVGHVKFAVWPLNTFGSVE